MSLPITTWDEAIEYYDDAINEQDDVVVCGLTFTPSRILRELDPTAYRCGLFDWLDGEGVDSDDLEGDFDL